MTPTLFLDLILAGAITWWLLIIRRTRRTARRVDALAADAEAEVVEMEEMAEKMRASMPDMLRQMADMPSQAADELGGPPTAMVFVAFSPAKVAVGVLSPQTDDPDEVVDEINRFWANRAKEALSRYE